MVDETNPDAMTDAQRLGEVANILAAGLLRGRTAPGRKREIPRHNCLEPSAKTSPPAINV